MPPENFNGYLLIDCRYNNLCMTGEADTLAASQDLAMIEGLCDEDIQDAIEERLK